MLLLFAALLPCLVSEQPGSGCPPDRISGAEKLPSPGVQYRMNEASATRSPWVDANGWRFVRSRKARYYYDVTGETAALAAAEAFAYQADAMIRADAKGVESFARMISFLGELKTGDFPPLTNIGVVDDGSDAVGELMNLLTRRNLLYRVVAESDPRLDINVQLGSREFPKSDAADPSRLAHKIRAQLTDDKRLVRIFGSEVVIVRLTGDESRARLHVLNYANRPVVGLRVRVLGKYAKPTAAVFGAPDLRLQDVTVDNNAIEFTLPELSRYAVIDLSR
jgi:hypothetical protein